MLKKELIQRSPIRVLEKSIHGGLGKGNLGVFAARKGVGKTACLAHVALDGLLRGEKVLHVSFSDNPHHIESWYEQIFKEMAAAYKLDQVADVRDEIVSNRLILHFKQADRTMRQVREHIDTVTSASSFKPATVIVDGYSFYDATAEDMGEWKRIASDRSIETWFSATLPADPGERDTAGAPVPLGAFQDFFSVIILLNPSQGFIELKLLKDHDSRDLERLRLKLDPRTLMIANYRV
jgi:hypothetical protein